MEITRTSGFILIAHGDWTNCYWKGRMSGEGVASSCMCGDNGRGKVKQRCNISLFTQPASRFRWGAAVQECCWRGLEARGVENGKLLLSNRIVHFPYLSWDIPGSGWISAEIRMRDDSCAATETALVSESKSNPWYSPALVFFSQQSGRWCKHDAGYQGKALDLKPFCFFIDRMNFCTPPYTGTQVSVWLRPWWMFWAWSPFIWQKYCTVLPPSLNH